MKTKIILLVLISFVTLEGIAQNKSEKMESLFYTTTVAGSYDEVFKKVENALKEVGFGIITQVDMHNKLKAKLNVDIPIYQILGVCSPKHAYQALQAEENIGVFLPCKVILKEKENNTFEIVTTNTEVLMGVLADPKLDEVAKEVNEMLKEFIALIK